MKLLSKLIIFVILVLNACAKNDKEISLIKEINQEDEMIQAYKEGVKALEENESLFLIDFSVSEGNQIKVVIDGDKGVYMVKVTAVNNAPELQDYSGFANTLNTSTLSSLNTNVYDALKNEADIEDNRATFF